jgi:hypothetical protein
VISHEIGGRQLELKAILPRPSGPSPSSQWVGVGRPDDGADLRERSLNSHPVAEDVLSYGFIEKTKPTAQDGSVLAAHVPGKTHPGSEIQVRRILKERIPHGGSGIGEPAKIGRAHV